MMIKSIFAILLLFAAQLFSQDTTSITIKMPVNISYFGINGTNYGFKSGFEKPWVDKEIHKKNIFRRQIVKRVRYFTGANVGYYRQVQDKQCFFIQGELGSRRTRFTTFFTEAILGLGYLRTFNEGTTYKVSDSGQVTKAKLAGSNYFMPSVTFGFGKTFKKNTNSPINFHVRLNTFFQYPHYHKLLTQFALETGINFNINKTITLVKIIKK